MDEPRVGAPGVPAVCAAARDAMEIAAVEPGGLDRLMASSDTAADAAHIVACPDCAAELARLRAIAALLGEAIPAVPPPELRARTLGYVREVGRDRRELAAAPTAPRWIGSAHRSRRVSVAVRALTLAAAIVLAIGGTALVAGSIARSDLEAERTRNAALVATAQSALRLIADPSAIHIPMRGGTGPAVGMAVVAPETYAATVVAVGLPEPPAGHEYACYIVLDGVRVLVGRMTDGGSTYAWVGSIPGIANAAPGSVGGYGVLLVPAGSDSTEGTPVLSGSV